MTRRTALAAPPSEDAPTRRAPAKPLLLAGLTAGLGAILVVLLMVFIMPSLKSGAHGLPLGLAGAPTAVAEVQEGLAAADADAFRTQTFASEADLRAAVADREIVGGLVADGAEIRAIVAGAGSPAIAGTIAETAAALADARGETLIVDDLVPLPEADPSGVGIGGLAFPLVFGGIVPAVAFRKFFPRSLAWAVGGMLAFSAVGGLLVAAVLMFVFGSTTVFWPVAAAMALGIAALALPLAGLQELFGGTGFTIGAMVMMFVGNPLAGIASGAAWLPGALGVIGQVLPPGAAGTLVRSAAYFGGAGGTAAALTLFGWVAAGAVLLALAVLRRRRATDPSAASAA